MGVGGVLRRAAGRRRHLFLFGHLRSHSSLLSHILGSHPQIDGYCETHTKYRTGLDLWRLHHQVRRLTGEPLRGDYVLDQILHDYPIARRILDSGRTRAIILVRQPRTAVRGIIEMGLNHSRVDWHRDFEQVARYYETRLAGLLRLTESLRGRVVFLEAESLVSNPQRVLDQLGAFLELGSPLQREYRRFPHSGEFEGDERFGGRVSPVSRDSRTAVSLPRPLAARLQNAYEFWCAAIRKSCPTIATSSEAAQDQGERSGR